MMSRWRMVATTVLVAAALGGCGGADNRATSGDGGAVQGAPPAAAGQDDKQQTGEQAAGPGAPAVNAPAPTQYRREDRAVVYTGDITVRVDNVDDAARRAGSQAESAGGFVSSDKRATAGTRGEAHLTLRIPADRFTGTIDELATLGKEESRNFSTEDRTQEVVDLDAQIVSQKASVDRTRALLAKANTIGEIVSVEAELAKRESALATLEARKRRLADLVALSTVNVHLLGKDAPSPVAAEDGAGFLAGLKAGWRGFLGAMTVLLAILGFLLPFMLVLGLPAAVVWWLLRRRRRPGPPPAVLPRTGPPPTAPPLTPAEQPAPGAGG